MARLPTPGGDAGNWGEVLNDFLRQEHNEDGALKQTPGSSLGDQSAETANVHGIADTSNLETQAGAQSKVNVHTASEGHPRITGDLSRGNRVGVIGDSLAGDPSNTAVGILAPRGRVFPWLCYLSRGRARYAGNKGVNSQTSTQIAARFQIDVIDQVPRWDKVLILAGTNDPLTGRMETTQTNIQTMVALARSAKIDPILATLLPNDGRTAAQRTSVDAYNQWLMFWGGQQGLTVLSLFAASVNPVTGNWIAGYSDDTVHPSMTGAYAQAQVVLDTWLRSFPPFDLPLHIHNQQGNNLLLNGCAIGGTTTAVNWSIGGNNLGTYTASVVAGTGDIKGNIQRVVFGGTGASYDVTALGASTGFVAGDRIAFMGKVQTTGFVAGQSYLLLKAKLTGGATPTYFLIHNTNLDLPWLTFYNEFVVPAGTTKIDGVATLTAVNANGGQGTLECSQFTMLNMTLLGLE